MHVVLLSYYTYTAKGCIDRSSWPTIDQQDIYMMSPCATTFYRKLTRLAVQNKSWMSIVMEENPSTRIRGHARPNASKQTQPGKAHIYSHPCACGHFIYFGSRHSTESICLQIIRQKIRNHAHSVSIYRSMHVFILIYLP
jgi:hypothetical protein